MTDRKKALEAFLDMIEDGAFPADTSARDIGLAHLCDDPGIPVIKHMYAAFSGSLDAAKALHEAVLPEWEYKIGIGWADLTHASGSPRVVANDEHEDSRAWLCAILKALIEQEGGE